MNETDKALGDRLKRVPAPIGADRGLSPAEARAEAERRLHAAWLSETASLRGAEIPPVAEAAPANAPKVLAPQDATPVHAQRAPQPSAPVAPQRAPSFPPATDSTQRGGVVENLEFARQRVEELRKLQEWRLGQERRVSEEIGRRNALAEASLDEELQSRREAEEHRLEQWKAETRAQFERALASEEAEFERRLAARRRDAEVELEARLLRRIEEAARRADALQRDRDGAQLPVDTTDPRLYVVSRAV